MSVLQVFAVLIVTHMQVTEEHARFSAITHAAAHSCAYLSLPLMVNHIRETMA